MSKQNLSFSQRSNRSLFVDKIFKLNELINNFELNIHIVKELINI